MGYFKTELEKNCSINLNKIKIAVWRGHAVTRTASLLTKGFQTCQGGGGLLVGTCWSEQFRVTVLEQ